MDPTSIVENTERTWQTDGQVHWWIDKVKPVCPTFNLIEVGV